MFINIIVIQKFIHQSVSLTVYFLVKNITLATNLLDDPFLLWRMVFFQWLMGQQRIAINSSNSSSGDLFVN